MSKDRLDKETGELFLGDNPVVKSFTARGAEILDTTPMELPLGYKPHESMDDKLRRIVREEVSKEASKHGLESFEEADDFTVDDGDDFLPSQYQLTDMQEERMLVARPTKEGRKHGKRDGERRKGSAEPVAGKAGGAGARDGGDKSGAAEQPVDDQSRK